MKVMYLPVILLVALTVEGCASMKKSKEQRQPRAQIVGTRAEADLEEAAHMREGGKKGEVRVRCTNEPKTGSRLRKRRCWFQSTADEERRETQDQLIRNNNRGNRFNPP